MLLVVVFPVVDHEEDDDDLDVWAGPANRYGAIRSETTARDSKTKPDV